MEFTTARHTEDCKQVSEEYSGKFAALWDSMDQEGIKESTAKKHTIINLSNEEEEKWGQRIQPLYDQYVKEKAAKGLPAAEAIKFLTGLDKE